MTPLHITIKGEPFFLPQGDLSDAEYDKLARQAEGSCVYTASMEWGGFHKRLESPIVRRNANRKEARGARDNLMAAIADVIHSIPP